MKSLSEIQADNAAVEKRIEAKRKASLRRLIKRLYRLNAMAAVRLGVREAVYAWDAKERRRG